MPMIIDLDPKKVPLTEFMKALGYEQPGGGRRYVENIQCALR